MIDLLPIPTMFGKRVVDDLYLHLSAVDQIHDPEYHRLIDDAMGSLPMGSSGAINVAKINLRTGRLSLLEYADFNNDPFPTLLASWGFQPELPSTPTHRNYASSVNPPILHRKELLVPPSHPGRQKWAELTTTAESLGLFDDTRTIGFRLNWERLIASKGYQLVENQFHPLGNEVVAECDDAPQIKDGTIQRHLTALTRGGLSAPVQLLIRHALLSEGTSIFDYGCGRGSDMAALRAEGFDAQGWDPYYAPDQPVISADLVNLGFVVNVIEDPAERVDALHRAFSLARRALAVSVMLYSTEKPGLPFGDGVITSRNTFQKYFSQNELKDYIEQVLHHEAFMVAPGVAFVFADKDLEQNFNAGRFRSHGVAARLLGARAPRVRVLRVRRETISSPSALNLANIQFTAARGILDALWAAALELGRLPESEEVPNLDMVVEQVGSLRKAYRLIAIHYDANLLEIAARTRADDVRLYLAAQQSSKRPAYRQLDPRLQRDIKVFFGDYRAAQAAGVRLLLDAADPSQLLAACEVASTEGLGWLDSNHSLQLHVSLVERLPAVLRAYVACGLILWDAISEVQLVKVHIGSGKLTLMEFDDFDSNPLPLLRRRIKVNVRKQDYDLFEYGTPEHPSPLLYRKSRYIHEEYVGYAEQVCFDEALERTGILDLSEFGPSPERLLELLAFQRLDIKEMCLVGSERIPDLDEPCGRHFTFRSFIECGETQQRLALKNLSLNPATYNAMYDLATQVLDPVIDYFGGIRLTYGFCSSELGKHIKKRVAPKLDQHAACEVGKNGRLICSRGGAACDFIVTDEDMLEVAKWIAGNLPFDRLYYYGKESPLHVSFGPDQSRIAVQMIANTAGVRLPRPLKFE